MQTGLPCAIRRASSASNYNRPHNPRAGAIGVPEKRKLFGERRNSYLERAIDEMTLFRRAADSSPYAVFSKTTYFLFGGCKRSGMNFDARTLRGI